MEEPSHKPVAEVAELVMYLFGAIESMQADQKKGTLSAQRKDTMAHCEGALAALTWAFDIPGAPTEVEGRIDQFIQLARVSIAQNGLTQKEYAAKLFEHVAKRQASRN